jgi:hypothetical protein
LVKPGLKFFKFVSVNTPAGDIDILPFYILSARHEGKPITGHAVDIIGKMHHISMPSLHGPDGLIEVPYLSPEFYPIQKR